MYIQICNLRKIAYAFSKQIIKKKKKKKKKHNKKEIERSVNLSFSRFQCLPYRRFCTVPNKITVAFLYGSKYGFIKLLTHTVF